MNTEYAQIQNNTSHMLLPSSWSPVSYAANAPVNGVILQAGLFNDVFNRNIKLLKSQFFKPNLL